MEFRGFSLSHQPTSFLRNSFSRPKMSDPTLISYPLTGHLDKPINKAKRWEFPKMPITLPIMPVHNKLIAVGKITCLVGGFVGSKSQRNAENEAIYPLDALIRQEIEEKFFNCSSHEPNPKMQNNDHNVVQELMATVCCLSLEPQQRLQSECSIESIDSNDSDFIVFDDGCGEIVQEDTDLTESEVSDDTDDDSEEENIEEETVIQENLKKVRFNPKIDVRVMRVWDYASRAARLGKWMQAARDRDRFHERITKTAEILEPVLCPTHREKIRTTLFDIK